MLTPRTRISPHTATDTGQPPLFDMITCILQNYRIKLLVTDSDIQVLQNTPRSSRVLQATVVGDDAQTGLNLERHRQERVGMQLDTTEGAANHTCKAKMSYMARVYPTSKVCCLQ